MIYIAICDDQIHQIERIKKCIENMNLKEVNIYTFTDEKEMISFCKNKNRNFIFILDIVLQNKVSGIDIAKKINHLFEQPIVLFISNYLEKVTDIFEADH